MPFLNTPKEPSTPNIAATPANPAKPPCANRLAAPLVTVVARVPILLKVDCKFSTSV